MNEIDKDQVFNIVQRALLDLRGDGIVLKIADVFPEPARVFLVGGFIRDVVLNSVHAIHATPRDLDFVVFHLRSDRLHEQLRALGTPRPTTLGGAKIRIGSWNVDVWTPYHQIEVAGGAPYACTPEQLLDYSTLTIDAVLFDFVESNVYERNFLRAINERILEVGQSSKWVAKWAPYHLAHVASVWSSTKFKLSSRTLEQVRKNDSPHIRALAIRYLKEHKNIKTAFALIDELMCTPKEIPAEQTVQ